MSLGFFAIAALACCDVLNRGAAYDNGRVFFNPLDNQATALDAKTGRQLYRDTEALP